MRAPYLATILPFRRRGETLESWQHLNSEDLMAHGRIIWVRGERRNGPMELIGVLELRADGSCRAAFAERTLDQGPPVFPKRPELSAPKH
jgi:hypothetical protein